MRMMPVVFCGCLIAVISILARMLLFEVKGHRGVIAALARVGAHACRLSPYCCVFAIFPFLSWAIAVAITPTVTALVVALQGVSGCGSLGTTMVMLCAFFIGSLMVRARD